jgi:hypothetical protein
MPTLATPSIAKEHCNTCLGDRNHDVLHVEQTSWREEVDEQRGIFIEGADTCS